MDRFDAYLSGDLWLKLRLLEDERDDLRKIARYGTPVMKKLVFVDRTLDRVRNELRRRGFNC